MSEPLIAVLFAVVFWFILVPVIAFVTFTFLDVIWRMDIGVGKLFWALALLALPGIGVALYWLFRPKDFDPWVPRQQPLRTTRIAQAEPQRVPQEQTEVPKVA